MEEFARIINITAVVQGIFLSMLLFFKKDTTVANRIFAIITLFVSVSMSTDFFRTTESPVLYYYMFLFNLACYPVYGPLIYFYTLAITENRQKSISSYLIHFLPVFIFGVYLMFQHSKYNWNGSGQLFLYLSENSLFSYQYTIILFLSIVLGYIMSSLIVIRNYKKKLKNYFSNLQKLNVIWLFSLFLLGSIFVIILILSLVFHNNRSLGYHPGLQVSIFGTFFVLNYTIAYFTIRHPVVFAPLDLKEKTQKYEKLKIDEKERKEYVTKLIEFMETEKPYLRDSLTLRGLAKKVNIPHYYISMILNTELKQNFYTFVNTYRVDEAKKCLSDPLSKEMNILTVAYNSGFNSKTTFNTIFRQIAGMTPSEFKKNTKM